MGGVNNFRYVPNPISWVDPSGLSCKEAALGLTAAAAMTISPSTQVSSVSEEVSLNPLSVIAKELPQWANEEIISPLKDSTGQLWTTMKEVQLPPLPQGVVDVAAGFGDGVSFGITSKVRDVMNTNGFVDHGSGAYRVSNVAGNTHSAFLGGGLIMSGAKNSGTAALYLTGASASSTISDIMYNHSSIPANSSDISKSAGGVLLDTASTVTGVALGSTPIGKAGGAIINVVGTTTGNNLVDIEEDKESE